MTNKDEQRIADYIEKNGEYDGVCTIINAPTELKTANGLDILGVYLDESHQVSVYAVNPNNDAEGYFIGLSEVFKDYEDFLEKML